MITSNSWSASKFTALGALIPPPRGSLDGKALFEHETGVLMIFNDEDSEASQAAGRSIGEHGRAIRAGIGTSTYMTPVKGGDGPYPGAFEYVPAAGSDSVSAAALARPA